MFQQPPGYGCGHSTLGQERGERLSQIMELQLGHSNSLAHSVPLLGGESICEEPFLPIWKRSNTIRKLRHDLLWNWALAVANGLVSLEENDSDGRLIFRDHTPNYFTTTRLPFAYDPAATCRLWETFLDDIMQSDTEYIRLLQQWCGYLFRPDLREQKFLLCVGEGANGKGVFFEVIQHLVGRDNCSEVGLAQFHRPFALFVETVELPEYVLQIVGQDSHEQPGLIGGGVVF